MNEHVKQFVEFWKCDNGHSADEALALYKTYPAIGIDLEIKRQKLLKYIVPVKTPRGMWICGFEPSQTNAVACLAADIEMSRKTLESIVNDIEELVLLVGGPVLKMLEDQLVLCIRLCLPRC